MNNVNHHRRWNDHADLSAPRPLLKFRDFAESPAAAPVSETPLSVSLTSEEEAEWDRLHDAEKWDGLS